MSWFNVSNYSMHFRDWIEGATNKANKKGETSLEITKGTFVRDVLEAYLVAGSTANKIRQLVLEEDSEWVQ